MSRAFLLVSTAGARRLVRVGDLQEIVGLMELTPLRHARGSCRGMANLRGTLVPVFDGSADDAPLTPDRFIVVLHRGRERIGLIVDEVHQVLALSDAEVTDTTIGAGTLATVALVAGEVLPVLEPAEVGA